MDIGRIAFAQGSADEPLPPRRTFADFVFVGLLIDEVKELERGRVPATLTRRLREELGMPDDGTNMTMERIAAGLQELVLRLANSQDARTPPDGWAAHEWTYVLGLASGAVMRARGEATVRVEE